jgi:hypothetical protein
MSTKNTHGGAGRGQGRKADHSDGQPTRAVLVHLDGSTRAIARAVGNGRMAAGIRKGMSMVCAARRINDQMMCRKCGLQWDIDDAEPPQCGITVARSRQPPR